MPPGTDVKEYYGTLDFGLSDTYLANNFSNYGRGYFPRPLDHLKSVKNEDGTKCDDLDVIKRIDDIDSILQQYSLMFKSGGIFATMNIANGTQYGPFLGLLENQPKDRRFAWEVSSFKVSILLTSSIFYTPSQCLF